MKVGDTLFYVPYSPNGRDQDPYDVKVTKVGRKWVTVIQLGTNWNEMRINIESMWADGGQYISPGRCYHSKELWQEEMNMIEAWSRFRKLVYDTVQPPKKLSLRDILNLEAKVYDRRVTGSLISGQDP